MAICVRPRCTIWAASSDSAGLVGLGLGLRGETRVDPVAQAHEDPAREPCLGLREDESETAIDPSAEALESGDGIGNGRRVGLEGPGEEAACDPVAAQVAPVAVVSRRTDRARHSHAIARREPCELCHRRAAIERTAT